ncbi:hypothetical protein FXV91_06895 [Methanosarcina sp. DH2]|uniref:hypothetical protein n=1 Tax=Methanosarcina sp. DH2 TaxID=2605639 RepID=UPI001E2D9ED3|nr:hypothetical protein [Methanosarcina sp. DH2]MCC4769939.1 hypothetical protein [Methanosarcina sp. DH2]
MSFGNQYTQKAKNLEKSLKRPVKANENLRLRGCSLILELYLVIKYLGKEE